MLTNYPGSDPSTAGARHSIRRVFLLCKEEKVDFEPTPLHHKPFLPCARRCRPQGRALSSCVWLHETWVRRPVTAQEKKKSSESRLDHTTKAASSWTERKVWGSDDLGDPIPWGCWTAGGALGLITDSEQFQFPRRRSGSVWKRPLLHLEHEVTRSY